MISLEQAILYTVAYADVFDYPLTQDEIHRYLWGMPAELGQVAAILRRGGLCNLYLSCITAGEREDRRTYYTLPGREGLVSQRLRREQTALILWSKAWTYAQQIGQLPFVRMVALTGSLAMGNTEPDADIDYLIITETGRLWLCRAGVVGLCSWAAGRGEVICPNYFLSERALALADRNFYSAHEFAQMIPLYGLQTYREMQARNPWVQEYLPNATGLPPSYATLLACKSLASHELLPGVKPLKQCAEAVLRTPVGAWLDRLEMKRKMSKYHNQLANHPESNFNPDWCKGHFHDHAARTLERFQQRVQEYGDCGWELRGLVTNALTGFV